MNKRIALALAEDRLDTFTALRLTSTGGLGHTVVARRIGMHRRSMPARKVRTSVDGDCTGPKQ
jgi:hypothetical protein